MSGFRFAAGENETKPPVEPRRLRFLVTVTSFLCIWSVFMMRPLFSLLAMVMLTSVAAGPIRAADTQATVPHAVIGVSDYQNFLVNWDQEKHPRLCAVIRSPQEYARLFHPAAVQRSKKPFAPPARFFEKEQILLVGCVMDAPKDPGAVFEVERVVAEGGRLEVHYRRANEQSDATFQVKNFLALRIPRGDYAMIAFFENQESVGTLNVAEGQWAIPAMADDAK
jgi:hypothetical protein